MATQVDTAALEVKVKEMYRAVASHPAGPFHFELGRALAVRLGYDADRLDRVPGPAVESFAGVGHFFDLLDPRPAEQIVDLGSGSGMDAFYAADAVGAEGRVTGVDFTDAQLMKARRLAAEHGRANVAFVEARIEHVPLPDESVDGVMSNGVINLCPDKRAVFAEAARLLRSGGRLAVADIVTEVQLVEQIVCNADLWAACIGGAAQRESYLGAIEGAGLVVKEVRPNPYEFLSDSAQGATRAYGVSSISLFAVKP